PLLKRIPVQKALPCGDVGFLACGKGRRPLIRRTLLDPADNLLLIRWVDARQAERHPRKRMGFLIKIEGLDRRSDLLTIETEIESVRRESGGRLGVGLFQCENATDQTGGSILLRRVPVFVQDRGKASLPPFGRLLRVNEQTCRRRLDGS